jgi:drug/metabolite transporter (DMT)-like permease
MSHVLVAMAINQAFGFALAGAFVVAMRESMPGTESLAWSAIGGASGAIGIGAFYLALSRGTMGIVAPSTAVIGATIPALVGIAGGEVPGPLLIGGMLVALLAIALISVPDATAGSLRLNLRSRPGFDRVRGLELGLIIVAGLGFAGFFLGVARAHATGGAIWWPLFVVRLAGLALVAITAIVVLASGRIGGVQVRRRALPVAVLAGVGDFGGNLFFILASAEGQLAAAVVLSSLYPVQTALLARLLVHERLNRVRLVGVGLAVLGVVLISLGQATAVS